MHSGDCAVMITQRRAQDFLEHAVSQGCVRVLERLLIEGHRKSALSFTVRVCQQFARAVVELRTACRVFPLLERTPW